MRRSRSISKGRRSDGVPSSSLDSACGEADRYIANCAKFDVSIDPSVVIALKTKWPILQPSSQFGEGAMLPLMGILDKNEHIKRLNLACAGISRSKSLKQGIGNSNARVLKEMLLHNDTVTELDLSNTGLDDDGIVEVCELIESNKKITKLNLSMNNFGEIGANALKNALLKNRTLQELDLSRNALGFQSINSLICACSTYGVTMKTFGNYVFEEILNSVTHGIAFLASIVGAFLLISTSLEHTTDDYHFWSCTLYSFALMFLFLSSTLFHSFFMLPATSSVLQILDHIGIYMVIAGSYTPILLISLHHSNTARVLCGGLWIAAVLGSAFAVVTDLNSKTSTIVELSMFLGMGFGILFVWEEALANLEFKVLFLVGLGGAAYVVGIIFFILGEIKPIYHVVWHIFVVIAAAIHWFTIYFFVAPAALSPSPIATVINGTAFGVDSGWLDN